MVSHQKIVYPPFVLKVYCSYRGGKEKIIRGECIDTGLNCCLGSDPLWSGRWSQAVGFCTGAVRVQAFPCCWAYSGSRRGFGWLLKHGKVFSFPAVCDSCVYGKCRLIRERENGGYPLVVFCYFYSVLQPKRRLLDLGSDAPAPIFKRQFQEGWTNHGIYEVYWSEQKDPVTGCLSVEKLIHTRVCFWFQALQYKTGLTLVWTGLRSKFQTGVFVLWADGAGLWNSLTVSKKIYIGFVQKL